MIAIKNFDFLVGKWSIINKRLKERLNNSKEWDTFPAIMESERIMNGLCVMDEFKTNHFGNDFSGLSIRILNPKTNEWTIYWADSANPELKMTEQVVGKFNNGIGEFFGTEIFKGKEVKLRFLWKRISEETAYWDQAYFDEINQKWETNWIMEFTRM